MKRYTTLFTIAFVFLAACADVSYVQKASPANPYKDYKSTTQKSIIGRGDPISKRQMKANALITIKGRKNLKDVMFKMAGTYNVAVRWGNGVRQNKKANVLVSSLSFDEARNYIEDVYDVQIIREGERRVLVLPSANEPRVELFAPGNKVSLSQAVRGLAEQCGFNVIISENKPTLANTKITTTLRDVTCYDAFAAILNPHGLSLEDKGDYYVIGGLPTRQWTVNLFEPNRTDERTVSYSSSFSGEAGDTGSDQQFGGSSKVTVKSDRHLWESLSKDLNDLLSNACNSAVANMAVSSGEDTTDSSLLPPPSLGGASDMTPSESSASSSDSSDTSGVNIPGCGYVRINKSIGLVQMRAPQYVLDRADEIVDRVEDIAGRRLLLEARVLAVKRTRDFTQGVNSRLSGHVNGKGIGGAGFSGTINSITAAVNSQIEGITGLTGATGGFFGTQGNDLDLVMQLVEQYGTTYQLMQPTIELMDRQQATLVDGTSQPFIIRTVTTDSTSSGSTSDVSTDLKYQFFGLQFSASAQIAEEGGLHTVQIQIPILTKVGDFDVPLFSGTTQIGTDKIPVPETRLIDQKVRLRDGEVKVIGGLTKTIAIDRDSGIPLLRNMPAFGKLVNEENLEFEQVEFIVLLQVKREE